jgi:ribosome-associated protein
VTNLEEKKAENIVLLDIRGLAIFADYFIICSGTSDRMINALVGSIDEHLQHEYGMRVRREGDPSEGWMLVDAGDIIVHVFSPDRRDYYDLEELWSHGKVLLHLQ